MSDSTNDGMLREWGTRLFYGMPKKGKPQRGRMPLVVGAAVAAAVLSGAEVRQRVRAAVRPGASQVVVKITGGGRGMQAIAAHMRYISRQGKPEVGGRGESLELEDEDGNKISGAEAIKDLQFDWRHSGSYVADDTKRREACNIVLSMPAGTPAPHVLDAAREFARETFDGHKYVFVLHEDTDSPHVHLSVKSERRDGVRLNPRKADLHRWRERFAALLQDRGINAIATRATTRSTRRIPRELWHARKPAGTVRKAQRQVSNSPAVQARAIEAWGGVATALANSEDSSDRDLALDVVRYVDQQFGDGRVLNRLRPGPVRGSPNVERD
jgi:hypothetical protein